jgi:hypothetical protein
MSLSLYGAEKEYHPWDVREVKISLGGEYDDNGFLSAEVFSPQDESIHWSLYLNKQRDGSSEFTLESMDIRSAISLRDFLIYALKDVQTVKKPEMIL